MKLTPAMRQYMEVKEQHPDALCLFRMGDFYETFYDDAKTVSRILDITLTARGKDETRAPLAGIPYHALDKYLGQLLAAGHTVVIVEQLEDPKLAKGVVKRGITRIVTPGTIVEQELLEPRSANYLCAIFLDDQAASYSILDISTGECRTGETTKDKLQAILARYKPVEVLHNEQAQSFVEHYSLRNTTYAKQLPTAMFSPTTAQRIIQAQFLQHQHLNNHELATCSLGALLSYVNQYKHNIKHVTKVTLDDDNTYLTLDETTIQHLDITKSSSPKGISLLQTIDTTKTPMGARLLKQWLVHPLQNIHEIRKRHGALSELKSQSNVEQLQDTLAQIGDIERMCAKLQNGIINPRELIILAHSLDKCTPLQFLTKQYNANLLTSLNSEANKDLPSACQDASKLINWTIAAEPTITVREGGFIKSGYNAELDNLRHLTKDTKQVLAEIQEREQNETGISSLKIKYNGVFGYFIEITSRFTDRVPAHYIRKQTLVNAERYVTPELKELEHKILTAQEQINTLEYNIYVKLVTELQQHIPIYLKFAQHIATIDVITCFAFNTITYNYAIPEMTQDNIITLKQSRHPVVERLVPNFVPNDCTINENQFIHVITGPNMAGKSTYMRQVALCILLAHCGCAVPAKEAKIGITDRIFTRIGAKDDVSTGQSTFMVEMQETASILINASNKSLVILDEIGRGTSTFDGISIAYAVAEDLRNRIKAKTLFATHYHVLTTLGEKSGVANYHSEVAQAGNDIVFLHKIAEGATDKSYGIHVAKLAGLPHHVIEEALKIQEKLVSEDQSASKIVLEKIQERDKIPREKPTEKQETTYIKKVQKSLLDLE